MKSNFVDLIERLIKADVDGIGDYQKVKQASALIEVEDMQLCVLSLKALIEAKKVMNRPRDKEAIIQLEAIKKLKQQKT